MYINIKNSLIVLAVSLFAFIGCKKEDKTFGDLTPPETPTISVDIAGKTAVDTAGDGSGKITVTVTAAHAINYKVDFGDGTVSNVSTNNTVEHTYSFLGLRNFIVTAIATGVAGLESTSSTLILIKKDYTPPAELITMLTNNSSKTWMVDSLTYAHFGVGPNYSYYPEWYRADALGKSGLGIYDDQYTFTNTGSFTHTTNNSLLGKSVYLTQDFDPSNTDPGDVNGDLTLLGPAAGNYTESFSYDGSPTSEFIIFQVKGHMGLYMGGHRYQVLERTADKMSLRYIGKDGNAWYVRIKAV